MNSTLKRLDRVHTKLLETVGPLDEQLFAQSPAENQWSISQIVHHLCLVEERVIAELEKELVKPPRQLRFLRTFIPTSIVAYRLVRVKAPKAVNPLRPPEEETNIANYNAARNRLKELCATHGKDRLRHAVFTHPFLGEIHGLATISFVGYHELRHHKQIREVLKQLGV
jgi:uncharacterized damage-inducible protein DinB